MYPYLAATCKDELCFKHAYATRDARTHDTVNAVLANVFLDSSSYCRCQLKGHPY